MLKLYIILLEMIYSYFTLSHKQKFMHFVYILIKYPNFQNGMIGRQLTSPGMPSVTFNTLSIK